VQWDAISEGDVERVHRVALQALLFPQKPLRARRVRKPRSDGNASLNGGVSIAHREAMRNITVAEENGLWVVTLKQSGLDRPQRYYCETSALARRWALLLGGPVKETVKAQSAA
jgi:hypothetical protein